MGPVLLFLLVVAMTVPAAPLVARAMVAVMAWLQTILQFELLFFTLLYPFVLLRIISSLWIYFKLDNMWANEVAYMAIFLLSPIIGFIIYAVTQKNMNVPPRGFEHAVIRDGLVHQPIFEVESPPPDPAAGATPGEGQPPPPPSAQPHPSDGGDWHEVQVMPSPAPPGHPPPPQASPPPTYHPAQAPPPPQAPPYPPPYAQPQSMQAPHQHPYAAPPHVVPPYPQQAHHPHAPWQQPQPAPRYGMVPAGPPQMTQRPWVQQPGPRWKKVGERLLQKRDYLAWYNPLLLIFAAMTLAGYIQLLILAPLMVSLLEPEPDMGSFEAIFSPGFIFVTILIQDAILVWIVWHQVVRRRVIPFTEMGIARAQLRDTGKVARWALIGLAVGLVLFTLSFSIEQGQAALGFEPDAENVIGPQVGDLSGYVIWLMSACIVAPLAEEFFFRGYAFYAFNKRLGLPTALFLSAVGFAVIHTNIYALLPITVAGIGLALAYHWTGSLVPAIIAHAVNNFVAVTLMYSGFYT
jgi:membrane protease YdiL (CAAX protease family)